MSWIPTDDWVVDNADAFLVEHWADIYCRRRFTSENKEFLWKRSKGHCFHCGKKIRKNLAEYDHVYPWVKGGLTDVTNGAASCSGCNRKKISFDRKRPFLGANLFIRRLCESATYSEVWEEYGRPSWRVLQMFDVTGRD